MLLTFWQHYLDPFLQSNLFIVLATLTAAYVALRVYRNQKEDERCNAANVILLEIEGAERQLEKISADKPFSDAGEPDVILMEVSSWDKYKHLFVADFVTHRNEWNKIISFYAQCKEYDDCVRRQNAVVDYNTEQMAATAQRILARFAEDHAARRAKADIKDLVTLEQEYIMRRAGFTEVFAGSNTYSAQIYHYIPQKFTTKAKRVLESIDRNISTSDAGGILRRLATTKQSSLARMLQALREERVSGKPKYNPKPTFSRPCNNSCNPQRVMYSKERLI